MFFKCLVVLIFSVVNLIAYDDIVIEKVNRVIDGDTIEVDLDCEPSVLCDKLKIRLRYIDTPEIRTRDLKEKEKGLLAKAFLEREVKRATFMELKECVRGKYFRLVCDLRVNGLSASELMISNGYARYYDGGEKIIW